MDIGVIGCGHIFTVGHGPALALYQKEFRDNTLLACCDVDPNMRNKAMGAYGFRHGFASLDEMLGSVKLDAAILCLPPRFTAEAAEKLLRAGIPTLIEKPPGEDIGETRRLLAVAEKTGTRHAVAFNRRSMPLMTEFRQTLAGRDIRYINLDFFRYLRPETCFYETAIHGIDALSYLAGSPYAELSVAYDENPCGGGDDFRITGRLASDTAVQMSFYPQSGATIERFTVCAQDYTGMLRLPVWGAYDSPGSATIFLRETSFEMARSETEMYITNGFYHQIKQFLDGVRDGTPPENTLDTCLQSMEIMQALKEKQTNIRFCDIGNRGGNRA